MNEMDKVLKKFFKENEPKKVFTYEEFTDISRKNIENVDETKLEGTEKFYYDYRKINMHRSSRILKTFKPNEDLVSLIKKVDKPQTWLVITEDWCGDSAQNLPYISKYIEFNPLIKIVIVLRDDNLDAIDNYFVEGNPRSIPKIVGFDDDGNELFIWGPRPKFAQDLVQQLKAEGYVKEEFNKELHLWYAKNRGKELEKELIVLVKNLIKK